MSTKNHHKQSQLGMSLLEAMIAMSIGIFLLAGVLSSYMAMKSTTKDTTSIGELQEAGRLAINILSKEISKAGFSGKYSPSSLSQASIDGSITVPLADCALANVNNSSFPSAALTTQSFFYLWSTQLSSTSALGCISGAVSGTDIIQIKRVLADPVAAGEALSANQIYLASNTTAATFFAGNAAVVPSFSNQDIWPYSHRVFYIGKDSDGVPGIRMRQLGSTAGVASIGVTTYMVPGIEKMHFMFGVDSDDDGTVNTYIPASAMNTTHWQNVGSNILTVRIYVLARSTDEDADYKNSNTYTLGDQEFSGGNDHYRRMLFTTTVKVQNAMY